jgi:hypothetical protein
LKLMGFLLSLASIRLELPFERLSIPDLLFTTPQIQISHFEAHRLHLSRNKD